MNSENDDLEEKSKSQGERTQSPSSHPPQRAKSSQERSQGPGPCPDIAELALFVTGNAGSLGPAFALIQQHVKECSSCRTSGLRLARTLQENVTSAFRRAGCESAVAPFSAAHFMSEDGSFEVTEEEATSASVGQGDNGTSAYDSNAKANGEISAPPIAAPDGKFMSQQPKRSDTEENQHLSFALAQKRWEEWEKDIVAGYMVRKKLRNMLTNGSGVVLDAGSHCLRVWLEIQKLRLHFLRVLTNNLMVLQSWNDPTTAPPHQVAVDLLGSSFDPEHLAFYGNIHEQLNTSSNRPTAVFIGASGVEFDDGIWIGYHAGERERSFKEELFRCPAKAKVILTTPSKIGNAGGLAFDLLQVDKIYEKAPIYIVTTEPALGEGTGARFAEAERAMQSPSIQDKLRQKKLNIHWIVVKRRDKTETSNEYETNKELSFPLEPSSE